MLSSKDKVFGQGHKTSIVNANLNRIDQDQLSSACCFSNIKIAQRLHIFIMFFWQYIYDKYNFIQPFDQNVLYSAFLADKILLFGAFFDKNVQQGYT